MLGNYLKEARTRAALTQEQVADLIGVSKNSYQNYELDKQTPRPKVVKKLAFALGVEEKTILTRMSKPQSSSVDLERQLIEAEHKVLEWKAKELEARSAAIEAQRELKYIKRFLKDQHVYALSPQRIANRLAPDLDDVGLLNVNSMSEVAQVIEVLCTGLAVLWRDDYPEELEGVLGNLDDDPINFQGQSSTEILERETRERLAAFDPSIDLDQAQQPIHWDVLAAQLNKAIHGDQEAAETVRNLTQSVAFDDSKTLKKVSRKRKK